MLDTETKTEWSHILGRAMKGRLKGSRLEAIPSDMVTWSAWKKEFPHTTVLAMPRTRHKAYTNKFYQNSFDFVVGFSTSSGMRHCSFAALIKNPVHNFGESNEPLLITFDKKSTSARVFKRELDGDVLEFKLAGDKLVDNQTGSSWNRTTGESTNGPLKGKRLAAHVGIVSYTDVWKTFHPNSKSLSQ